MRILGFSTDWINYETGHPKLQEDVFTTFRFKRRDRDWEVGEQVQVVIKPRTPGREVLGPAMIIAKEIHQPWLEGVTETEARRDGFQTCGEMYQQFCRMHGERMAEPISKLTVRWIKRGKL